MLSLNSVLLCVVLAITFTNAFARQDAINNDIVVNEADRKIDISTHLVKSTTAFTLENSGKASVGYFLVPLDAELQNYLSYFSASVSNFLLHLS